MPGVHRTGGLTASVYLCSRVQTDSGQDKNLLVFP